MRCGDLVQKRELRGAHRERVRCLVRGLLRILEDRIGEAQLDGLLRVHPCLVVHQVADLRAGEVRLDLVGVDDALLHLVQHADGLLHVLMVAVGSGHGVVDHHERGGCHEHPRARHRDHRGRARGDPVDLHRDGSRIVHEHRVDAAGRDAIPSGAVDPDGHLAAVGEQLIAELLGGDIIIEPTLLGDRA